MDFTIEDLALVIIFTDLLDDDEVMMILLAMLEEEMMKVPRHLEYERFDLQQFSDFECKLYFRFDKEALYTMKQLFNMQDKYVCSQGSVWRAMEGLCVVLRRLAFPNRLFEIVQLFGRSETELSMIFNDTIKVIHASKGSKLTEVNSHQWLDFQSMADTVHAAGSPLQNIWGFIDGTLLGICRPSIGQESVYSGHKRKHGFKFQSVMLPNGIILHFFGPTEGRRHDSTLFTESEIESQIEDIVGVNGQQLAIYGDAAYANRPYMFSPVQGAAITNAEKEQNARMSKLRCCVEWGFSKIGQLFAYSTYPRQLKALLQPVSKIYIVCALFTNCHTCLYGSQTSEYFDMRPPTLDAYLN